MFQCREPLLGDFLIMSEALFAGRQILLVEDEYLIAWALQDVLTNCGAHVVGPAASVEDALELLEHEKIDGAILDVSLGHDKVYPVAAALTARNIPFVFATGYTDLPLTWQHILRFEKPVNATSTALALFG